MNEPSPPSPTALELVISAVFVILIGVLLSTKSEAAEGRNWCSDWADGYAIGFCWSKQPCLYIPPQVCPYPKPNQHDGYMAGLNKGLKDGEQASVD